MKSTPSLRRSDALIPRQHVFRLWSQEVPVGQDFDTEQTGSEIELERRGPVPCTESRTGMSAAKRTTRPPSRLAAKSDGRARGVGVAELEMRPDEELGTVARRCEQGHPREQVC